MLSGFRGLTTTSCRIRAALEALFPKIRYSVQRASLGPCFPRKYSVQRASLGLRLLSVAFVPPESLLPASPPNHGEIPTDLGLLFHVNVKTLLCLGVRAPLYSCLQKAEFRLPPQPCLQGHSPGRFHWATVLTWASLPHSPTPQRVKICLPADLIERPLSHCFKCLEFVRTVLQAQDHSCWSHPCRAL